MGNKINPNNVIAKKQCFKLKRQRFTDGSAVGLFPRGSFFRDASFILR